jgi:hypothetical protein
MTLKDIQDKYGVPTRDVLRAAQDRSTAFPMPVRVIGSSPASLA